jgi:hypothetical protein
MIICKRCEKKKKHVAKGLCHSCYNSEWASKNPEKRRGYNLKYREKNRDKISAHLREWKKQNKEKVNAHARAKRKFTKTRCSLCGSKENLQVHHTNYLKDEGVVLCCPCHRKEHKKYKKS